MTTLTTQFQNIPVGGICTATIAGERHRVKRIEPVQYGHTVYNVQKLDGRKGRSYVWSAAIVTIEQEQAALEQDYRETLADFEAMTGRV